LKADSLSDTQIKARSYLNHQGGALWSSLSIAQRLAELRLIRRKQQEERKLAAVVHKVYNSYFDESGTHDQSDLVVVGGLVSTYQSWIQAEREWEGVLNHKHIAFFHFTDFMARRPKFNWSDPERDNFMERLTTVIGDNIALGVAYGVFRDEYKHLPQSLRAEFKDIYHCCTYFCFDTLRKWEKHFKGPSLPRPFEFLFDRKPSFEGHAASIYNKVIKDLDAEGFFGNMSFGSKTQDKPLQMADLLVGAAARQFRKQRTLGNDLFQEKSVVSMNRRGRLFLVAVRKDVIEALIQALQNREA
jgi:hypothetical protein